MAEETLNNDEAIPVTDGTEGVVVVETAETQETPEPSWMDKLSAEGFQFQEGETEQQANERLFEAWRQQKAEQEQFRQQLADLQSKSQFAEQLKQQLFDPNYLQWKQSQATQAPQGTHPSQAASAEKWWDRPSVDPILLSRYYAQDADGSLKPKADAPMELQAQVERQRVWDDQWANDLVHNGEQAFYKGVVGTLRAHPEILQELLNPFLEQQLQTRDAQSQKNAFVDAKVQENRDWMFQKDIVTGEPRQDASGQYLMTDKGAKFEQYFQDAMSRTQDVEWAWKAAYAQMSYELGDPKRAQSKELVAQSRKDFLNRNTAIPPRNGTVLPDEQLIPQNPHRSPGRDFLAAYRDS